MNTPCLHSFHQPTSPPCLRWGASRLYVVPACHNRLAYSAQLVAAADAILPDVIAVELPATQNCPAFFKALDSVWPRPGALMITPNGGGADSEGRRSIIPVSVADSIMVALKLPALLARRHPTWKPEIHFIDAEDRPQKHQGTRPEFDDWAVVALPDGFLLEGNRLLTAGLKRDSYDDVREAVMAARLGKVLKSGKSVLATFGAAHTPGIAAALAVGAHVPKDPAALGEGAKAPSRIEPLKLNATHQWANGLLDSSPGEVFAFQEHLLHLPATGLLPSFDKPLAAQMIAAAAAVRAAKELRGGEFSIRSFQQWWKYSRQSLTLSGRWTALSFMQFARQANDTIGPRFVRLLEEEFLRYPGGEDADGFLLFANNSGTGAMVRPRKERGGKPEADFVSLCGGRSVDIPEGAEEIRERLSDDLEGKDPEPSSWHMVPAASEQRLHRTLYRASRAIGHRTLASRPVREPISVRFEGSPGIGFDLRGTLRARCRGDAALYVKQPGRRRFAEDTHPGACDGKCPIVFVFDPEAKATSTDSGMFCLPGNTVYASHYAYSSKTRLANGAIRQGQICWFLALLREIAPYNPEAISRLVKSLPPKRLCTRRPWGDSDLDDFSGPDKLIGCAIKHAGDHIILVAKRGFTPSPEVQAFAKARKVNIARVFPAQLDSRLFARLSLEHIVPASGAYSAPYDWTEKYVVPV